VKSDVNPSFQAGVLIVKGDFGALAPAMRVQFYFEGITKETAALGLLLKLGNTV
jgi:hypothetical protein